MEIKEYEKNLRRRILIIPSMFIFITAVVTVISELQYRASPLYSPHRAEVDYITRLMFAFLGICTVSILAKWTLKIFFIMLNVLQLAAGIVCAVNNYIIWDEVEFSWLLAYAIEESLCFIVYIICMSRFRRKQKKCV